MVIRILTLPFRYLFSLMKKRIGKLDYVKIESLYAFGNEKKILVKARVIEAYKQSRPSEKKTYFQNILATLRRYAGSQVPDIEVEVRHMETTKTVKSDNEGIIDCYFEQTLPSIPKHDKIYFRIVMEEGIEPEENLVEQEVIRFDSRHPMGIISDIDDTIIISHATQIGKKFWLSISKNAYTRRHFPGVSKFYHALSHQNSNPFFYVSSSEWNLFDMINDFLKYRNIPDGVLLLKDFHIDLTNIFKSGGGDHNHKIKKIEMLMNLYPFMKFVLIGDSGQHDPELYAEVIKKFPNRVLSVYIREVGKNDIQRRRKLMDMMNEIPKRPEFRFVTNTEEAIEHAKENNLI
ncbi:MAG: phosphatase domain-containing protein [Bacteroidota bacterium]